MSGFSYAVVETALAKVFGADAMAQKRAFRGRLQHLRRLGTAFGRRRPWQGNYLCQSEYL